MPERVARRMSLALLPLIMLGCQGEVVPPTMTPAVSENISMEAPATPPPTIDEHEAWATLENITEVRNAADFHSIQAAIDDLPPYPEGGMVYIPAGEWIISEPIRLRGRLVLQGAGILNTNIIPAPGANIDVLLGDLSTHTSPIQFGLTIRDLSINVVTSEQDVGVGLHLKRGIHFVRLDNFHVTGAKDAAIRIADGHAVFLTSVLSEWSGIGLFIDGTQSYGFPGEVTVADSRIESIRGEAVRIEGPNVRRVFIHHSTFWTDGGGETGENGSHAIVVRNAGNVILDSNWIGAYQGFDGIRIEGPMNPPLTRIEGTGTAAIPGQHILITGNRIYRSRYGISLEGMVDYVTIANNDLENNFLGKYYFGAGVNPNGTLAPMKQYTLKITNRDMQIGKVVTTSFSPAVRQGNRTAFDALWAELHPVSARVVATWSLETAGTENAEAYFQLLKRNSVGKEEELARGEIQNVAGEYQEILAVPVEKLDDTKELIIQLQARKSMQNDVQATLFGAYVTVSTWVP